MRKAAMLDDLLSLSTRGGGAPLDGGGVTAVGEATSGDSREEGVISFTLLAGPADEFVILANKC